MNVVCSICSELLKSDDTASTICGHVFHTHCLETWLTNSRTCPTCRKATTSEALIKLFFEVDDSKANINLDDILKTNEALMKNLENAQKRANKFETEFRELDAVHQPLAKKVKTLERQKQLDDMAIAGLKGIKDESANEIVSLNQQNKTLKLDFLAERQLRRSYQTLLHGFDPQNENYNSSIVVPDVIEDYLAAGQSGCGDEIAFNSRPNVVLVKPTSPLFKLSCEAKEDSQEQTSSAKKVKDKRIELPKKMQKRDQDGAQKVAFNEKHNIWNDKFKLNQPPTPSFYPELPSRPSTSAPSSTNREVSPIPRFGEMEFKAFTPPTTRQSKGVTFNFHSDAPDFSATAASAVISEGSLFVLPNDSNIPSTSRSTTITGRRSVSDASSPRLPCFSFGNREDASIAPTSPLNIIGSPLTFSTFFDQPRANVELDRTRVTGMFDKAISKPSNSNNKGPKSSER